MSVLESRRSHSVLGSAVLFALQVEKRHPTGPCFNFRAVKKGLVSERSPSLAALTFSQSRRTQLARSVFKQGRLTQQSPVLGWLGIITIRGKKNANTQTKLALHDSCTAKQVQHNPARRLSSARSTELVSFDKVNG